MTTVTLDPTPTEQVTARGAEIHTVTDKRGRTLSIKRPNLIKQFDLLAALGELADNATYRLYVTPIIYLISIDGYAVPMNSKIQIRALIERLDNDGFEALTAGIKEHFPADTQQEEARVKKSDETGESGNASGS